MKYEKHMLAFCMGIFAVLSISCSEDSPSEPKDTFDASIVCPTEGLNRYNEPMRGTFTDERDGQVYKYVTIGEQVWMAENLKFDAPYSQCYDKIEGFCDTFGKFYSLHVDGEGLGIFDQVLVDTICPAGWHVPSLKDWNSLAESMGGIEYAGPRLMSSEDFGERYTPGSDDCAFNSLPAGSFYLDGSISSASYVTAVYWTSSSVDFDFSYTIGINKIFYQSEKNEPKMSLRCLRN